MSETRPGDVAGERANADARPHARRWIVAGTAAALALILGYIGVTGAPYLFNAVTLESEVAAQIHATTGLTLTSTIPGRFDLLPRPHVVIHQLHVGDETGTLSLDAEKLNGDVRLLPLIAGRIELTSLTLTKPRIVIDLDGAPMRPDSMIGRAMRGGTAGADSQPLGVVTLLDGSAVLKSRSFRRAPNFEAINLTLDWRDIESPATLTGSLALEKTEADIAAWIAQPASLMRGEHSAVAVRLHSAPIDVSANGDLVSSGSTGFKGHLSTTAASVPRLLDLIGNETPMIAPFVNVALDSDATVTFNPPSQTTTAQTTIDLPKLKLKADGNDFEGTLAFQSGERPALSGTLATEQLTLAPFLHRFPVLYGAGRGWSRENILGREPQPLDLDLRVSATHMKLEPFTVDDAALSVMTRGTRTEVALADGKAYGGIAKGRISIGVADEGISVRGNGALTGADAATLSWDALGRPLATGTMTASINVDSLGDSPATLMRALHGSAKLTAADGEISGVDIGFALHEIKRGAAAGVATALHSGRTPFSTLAATVRIDEGVATLEDSTLKGSDALVVIGGSADIGARSLDLHANAAPPAAGAGLLTLDLGIGGSFDKPRVVPQGR